MEYKLSKESAEYLNAVRLLDEGASKVYETVASIYGESSDKVVESFSKLFQEAREEVFRLFSAHVDINLGDKEQTKGNTATI